MYIYIYICIYIVCVCTYITVLYCTVFNVMVLYCIATVCIITVWYRGPADCAAHCPSVAQTTTLV